MGFVFRQSDDRDAHRVTVLESREYAVPVKAYPSIVEYRTRVLRGIAKLYFKIGKEDAAFETINNIADKDTRIEARYQILTDFLVYPAPSPPEEGNPETLNRVVELAEQRVASHIGRARVFLTLAEEYARIGNETKSLDLLQRAKTAALAIPPSGNAAESPNAGPYEKISPETSRGAGGADRQEQVPPKPRNGGTFDEKPNGAQNEDGSWGILTYSKLGTAFGVVLGMLLTPLLRAVGTVFAWSVAEAIGSEQLAKALEPPESTSQSESDKNRE